MFLILSNLMYLVLLGIALWGGFCVSLVWMRVKQKQFESEELQGEFLEAIEEQLSRGEFETASQVCVGDRRAMAQLSQLAIDNRKIGYNKVKQLVADRFQRDILADLENWLSWVHTVIKAAPMVGLLGTVMGMMGAFSKLAVPDTQPDPAALAQDIQFALITTACGLAIAIPLVLCVAAINIRIKKLEDLVTYGLNQFLEVFKEALIRFPGK
ncbi:MAG TPA: MotA/TolQ/ExbB proton channel family protein [Pirellulaceae bacterium]|nr:MotA/TolQ/ExbB proton channel family protein [Pirellulaceae bacterium]HMO90831.1 MotA/TolQ/ExbB proton channel family protein [Pirellulaceae bacterium]HMP68082.1 MotA/TolQ/ExbB proton channel family protein [Pirellulaceae bacterium]